MKIIIIILVLLTACSPTTVNKKEQEEIKEINYIISTEETERIRGERIDGPANVRDSVNGKLILSLNDNVLVETAPEEGKWFLIGLHVKLTEKQFKEFKIFPNTDLYSYDGNIIGKSKDTIGLWMADNVSGFFGAYTHINNIKKHSIPERALESEVSKGHLTLMALGNFVWTFDFKDYGENAELKYKQLFIYESFVVDPSPRDRITLLFDKNDSLVGVVHNRKLNLVYFKTYELVRGHSLTVVASMDKNEIKRIIDDRVNYYNSVD